VSDVFPALVSIYSDATTRGWEKPFPIAGLSDAGAIKFTECRVIVHKNKIIVGAETGRGPSKVFEADVAEVFVEKPYTRVLTTDGQLVVFALSKGCGCGSRLRSWNPYGNVVRSKND